MSIVKAKRNIKASNGSVKRRKVATPEQNKKKATPNQVRQIEALSLIKATTTERARIIVLAQRANRAWADRTISNLQARAA